MTKTKTLAYSMVLLSSLAFAETTLKTDSVIISATGFEQDADSNIRNVIVISGDELRDKGYNNLEEALTRQAGINFVSFGDGSQKNRTIDMRGQGVKANMSVKFMVDGVPMNSLDTMSIHYTGANTDPAASIDINDIERIEIIPGGGAVLYGNGTRGGAINIITKKQKNDAASVSFKENIFQGGNHGQNLNANFSHKINDKAAFSLNVNGFNEHGYRDGDKDKGFFLNSKLYYDFSDDIKATIGFGYFKDNYETSSYLSKSEVDKNPRQKGQDETTYHITRPEFNANLEHRFSDNFESNVQVFWQKEKIDQNGNRSYPKSLFEDSVKGTNIKHKYNYADKSYLVFGYSYEDHRGATDSDVSFGAGMPTMHQNSSAKKQSHGFYALDSHQFTDIFNLSGGARYEYAHYKVGGVSTSGNKTNVKDHTNNFALEITPNAAYSDTGKVYVKYERGFTSPSPLHFRQTVNRRYYLNKDIKSEKYDTYEVGVSDYLFGFYGVNAALFYTLTHDEISFSGGDNPHASAGTSTKYYNIPKTRRYGLELNLRQDLLDDKLSFYENFAFVNAKVTEGARPEQNDLRVPLVSKYKATAGVNYAWLENFSTFADITYNSKQKDAFSTKAKWIKDYFLTDIGAVYTYKNLKVIGGIKNLFDEHYYKYQYTSTGFKGVTTTEALAGDGRSYYVEFKYNF